MRLNVFNLWALRVKHLDNRQRMVGFSLFFQHSGDSLESPELRRSLESRLPIPENLLRQNIVNNLARLFFYLKKTLPGYFLRLFLEVILDNEKVFFSGFLKAIFKVKNNLKK